MSTDRITPNNWHKVELSWDPTKGLELFVNKARVAGTSEFRTHAPLRVTDHVVYLGRPTEDNTRSGSVYADAVVDELEYWFANRDRLLAAGLLDGLSRFSTFTASVTIFIHV